MTSNNVLPLADCAKHLGRNYETMRHHAYKHKDTFPAAKVKTMSGRGVAWDVDDIEEWYRQKEGSPSNQGKGQFNPSRRASLGHKFRKVRMKNQCSECPEPFYEGEQIVELREGDELYLMHEECYDRYSSSKDGVSSTESGDS